MSKLQAPPAQGGGGNSDRLFDGARGDGFPPEVEPVEQAQLGEVLQVHGGGWNRE